MLSHWTHWTGLVPGPFPTKTFNRWQRPHFCSDWLVCHTSHPSSPFLFRSLPLFTFLPCSTFFLRVDRTGLLRCAKGLCWTLSLLSAQILMLRFQWHKPVPCSFCLLLIFLFIEKRMHWMRRDKTMNLEKNSSPRSEYEGLFTGQSSYIFSYISEIISFINVCKDWQTPSHSQTSTYCCFCLK